MQIIGNESIKFYDFDQVERLGGEEVFTDPDTITEDWQDIFRCLVIDQQDDTTHDFYLTNENENGEEVFDEAFERCYDIDQLEDDLANSDVLISHVVYPEILTDWKFGM